MSELYLPDGRRARWQCNACGEQFGRYREFESHVVACARENMHAIHTVAQARKGDIFAPWDPEAEDYLAGVGRRMLAEGRMTLKRSERIRNG